MKQPNHIYPFTRPWHMQHDESTLEMHQTQPNIQPLINHICIRGRISPTYLSMRCLTQVPMGERTLPGSPRSRSLTILRLQFSHTSSTEYTSSAAQSSNWLTEVFSSASDIEEPDVKIHADETSPLSSTSEATSSPGGKAGVCISFVNVTGAPTKDGRSQARKIATAARKKERQVRLRRHKREAVLIAGSGLTDDIVACTTEGILPIEHYNTFKIPAISRFSASRSDPFIKYPLELSHGERKLLDHSMRTTRY